MQYEPPFGPNWPNVPDPNASYVNGNPAAGIAGSIPPAQSIEYPMREVVNMITKGGYIPSDDDLFQLTRAARRAYFAFATDTGTVNALSVAVDPPLTAYEQGTMLHILCAYANTGPCTIRVNGLPAAQIVRKDGTSLLPGDLSLGGVATLIYDGANWQLTTGSASAVTVTGGWFNGADWIVDVGSVNHIQGSPPIAPTAYNAGQGYAILVKATNTGAVDVNVNSLGVKPLMLPSGLPLIAGDIVAGMTIYVRFDGTNFTMLNPIYWEKIASIVQFVVGPNTGADFPDLNTAMTWMNRRRIGINGGVTFMLQGASSGPAMIHTYNAVINLEHPNGDRITIAGPTPAFVPAAGNFTSSGYSAAAINADSNANVTMLRNAFRAEIRLGTYTIGSTTYAAQLQVRGYMNLQNLLVTGGATMGSGPAQQNLIYVGANSMCWITCVAAAIASGCTWYVDVNSSVNGQNFYAVGSQLFSVGMSHNSNIVVGTNFIVAGAYVDGVQATMNAVLQADSTNYEARFYSIGQFAMNHWGGSAFHMQYTYALYCAWGLVQVSGASTNYVADSQISYSNSCVNAYQGAYLDFSNGYGAAIGGYSHVAAHMGGIYAAGFQNTWVTSPARNTFGNGGGYIEG